MLLHCSNYGYPLESDDRKASKRSPTLCVDLCVDLCDDLCVDLCVDFYVDLYVDLDRSVSLGLGSFVSLSKVLWLAVTVIPSMIELIHPPINRSRT